MKSSGINPEPRNNALPKLGIVRRHTLIPAIRQATIVSDGRPKIVEHQVAAVCHHDENRVHPSARHFGDRDEQCARWPAPVYKPGPFGERIVFAIAALRFISPRTDD